MYVTVAAEASHLDSTSTSAGKVTPLIDRAYRLEEIREAVRYAETFHTRGKLVIEI